LRRRVVKHRHIQRAIVQAFEQTRRNVDLGVQRNLGRMPLHPHQPLGKNGVPQADLSRHAGDIDPAGRQPHLLARLVPDLHQRRGMAHEPLARGCQAGAGLVPDEKLPPEALFKGPDPRTHRGLCYVQTARRRNKTARRGDLEERSCKGYVHWTANILFALIRQYHSLDC